MSVTLTFPEIKRYKWEGAIRWSQRDIVKFLREQQRQSPKSSTRWQVFEQVIEAIFKLTDDRGVESFKGDSVKKLLIAAATDHGWFVERPDRTEPSNVPMGEKWCRRCHEIKSMESFRAVATPAQNKRNGWHPDARTLITSSLCAPCRESRQKKAKRTDARRTARVMKKEGKAPPLLQRYEKSIANVRARLAMVFKRHTVTLRFAGPDGTDAVYLEFKDSADQDFYTEQRVMLGRANNRLHEAVDEGRIPHDAKGEWYELLTPQERQHLYELYQAASWMAPGYKKKMPILWDNAPKPDEVASAEPIPEPVRRGVSPEKPATDWSAIPWEDM
jgi:hypothetical protein